MDIPRYKDSYFIWKVQSCGGDIYDMPELFKSYILNFNVVERYECCESGKLRDFAARNRKFIWFDSGRSMVLTRVEKKL